MVFAELGNEFELTGQGAAAYVAKDEQVSYWQLQVCPACHTQDCMVQSLQDGLCSYLPQSGRLGQVPAASLHPVGFHCMDCIS